MSSFTRINCAFFEYLYFEFVQTLFTYHCRKFQAGPLSGVGGPADGSPLGHAVTSQQVCGNCFLVSSSCTKYFQNKLVIPSKFLSEF